MKIKNQELERKKQAYDGYDQMVKNKAKPDLTTSRNEGEGKSKRDGCGCCGCWEYNLLTLLWDKRGFKWSTLEKPLVDHAHVYPGLNVFIHLHLT